MPALSRRRPSTTASCWRSPAAVAFAPPDLSCPGFRPAARSCSAGSSSSSSSRPWTSTTWGCRRRSPRTRRHRRPPRRFTASPWCRRRTWASWKSRCGSRTAERWASNPPAMATGWRS